MKQNWLVSLFIIIALLLVSVPLMGAAPVDNQGKGPLDKIVFVHYPKHETGKPGTGGVTLTGVLCPDFKYSGIRWLSMPVTYYVNAPDATALDGIVDSFAAWNAASTKINFYYAGATDTQGNIKDSFNVISWGQVEYTNAIAVTYIWYYRNNKQIYEVDTVMNSDLPWSYTDVGSPANLSGAATPDASRYADPSGSGTSGTYDIRDIMTHEAGHWILLSDLYNGRDSLLTMYGYGSTGEISKDTLAYGDELGVEKAYGQ
jgi:hypothetical protein